MLCCHVTDQAMCHYQDVYYVSMILLIMAALGEMVGRATHTLGEGEPNTIINPLEKESGLKGDIS